MRILLILLSAVIASGVSHLATAQQIYKVVNKDGSVTYTDRPQPDSQPVSLGPDNRMVSPPAPVTTPTARANSSATRQRQPSEITILQPEDQATVRNNAGNLQIAARVTNTQQGDKYQLFLNDELHSEQDTPLFTLNNLPRGAHSFYIVHKDNTGKTLASTTPRTFYLHQASRLINNN